MNKHDFTALYEQWFALHPFKKRDWVELGKVHYQAFSRESPALLQEALGMLTEEIDNFPSPKQIRAKLNALSNTKTEGGEGKTNTTSENEMIATRLLEHKMGVEYNGEQVKKPDGFPLWIDQLVDKTITELGPKYPMKTLLGTLGYLVVQSEGRR